MAGCAGCSFRGMSTAVEQSFVGVRFGEETNLAVCASIEPFSRGDHLVVETEQGPTFGWVERAPMPIFKPCQKSSAMKILRRATETDVAAHECQRRNELEGKRFCQQHARELGLEDMKVSKVRFSLDNDHATFYFTANGRVDFRQLVRDLGRQFSVRVKMVQIGARDEAGLLGGVGVCGRTLCCSSWLKDFQPISIQMAKRQGLSLNPSKISGQCGRLLCCLAYEDDQYKKRRPERGAASELPEHDQS